MSSYGSGGPGFGPGRSGLGANQEGLLSELVHDGGWCLVAERICGSTYGGRSRHERMVVSLQKRGVVEIRKAVSGPDGYLEARAVMPAAANLLDR